jgi:hypothetical protein
MTGEIVKPPMARKPADDTGALDNEPPLSVGVRNPFVYAEHKSGKKIDWDKMKLEEKKRTLAEAFKMPYEKLFDSKNKESPLFVGDTRACTLYPVDKWAPYPDTSTYVDTSVYYTDPVQGALPDCYFIAALSSVAFQRNALLPNQPTAPYKYTFYNPSAQDGGVPTPDSSVRLMPNTLPLDVNGNYSYSKSFTPREIWVAMYEKGFACWVNKVTDKPDYSKICTGDPVNALVNLTGLKFSTYKPGTDVTLSNATKYSTKDFGGDATKIYNKIKSKCIAPVSIVVKYPMVAYTYNPSIETPPSGITYTDATIVANHAYSVLGVYSVAPNNYIVMRNPWGQMGVGPGSGDPSGLPPGALASGTWNGLNLAISTDAIFALRADVFRDYFKGFGWVTE